MNTNRRDFVRQLAGIGLFAILPGAGRLWRAERKVPQMINQSLTETLRPYQEAFEQCFLSDKTFILAQISRWSSKPAYADYVRRWFKKEADRFLTFGSFSNEELPSFEVWSQEKEVKPCA